MKNPTFEAIERLQLVQDYLAAFQKTTGISLRLASREEGLPSHAPALGTSEMRQARLQVPIVINGGHVATLLSEVVQVGFIASSRDGTGAGSVVRLTETQFLGMERLLSIFAQHISVFSNRYLAATQKLDPPWLTHAKEHVQTHYPDPIQSSEVSTLCQLKPAQFSANFKKLAGMTFTEYVARVRLERAKEMLTDRANHVEEIAYSCGFQSVSYFNRVFKYHTGLTPCEFRASLSFGTGGKAWRETDGRSPAASHEIPFGALQKEGGKPPTLTTRSRKSDC